MNAHDVYKLIRSITLDTAGTIYKDDILLPAIQSAADDLMMELASHGYAKVEGVVDLNLAAGVGDISVGSSPPLPDDFIAPQRLWEKPYGGTTKFVPINPAPHGRLSDVDPTDQLRQWLWQDGKIKFLAAGATRDTTVRIEYIKTLLPITDSGSSIDAIAGARNYLAYAALAICGIGRADSDMLQIVEAKAQRALDKILDTYTTAEQFVVHRREPYGTTSDEDW